MRRAVANARQIYPTAVIQLIVVKFDRQKWQCCS